MYMYNPTAKLSYNKCIILSLCTHKKLHYTITGFVHDEALAKLQNMVCTSNLYVWNNVLTSFQMDR